MLEAKISRRRMLATLLPAGVSTIWAAEKEARPHAPGVSLHQEALCFDLDELEPYLDARTLKLHYAEHHAEHLRGLHTALDEVDLKVGNVVSLMPCLRELKKPAQVKKSILQLSLAQRPMPTGVQQLLPEDVQRRIRLHGGAHVNHTAFWRFLRPRGKGAYGPLNSSAKAISDAFGTFQTFKEAFTAAALNHFGPGWAWLVYRPDGRLVVTTTRGEDNPLMKDYVDWQDEGRPLLALDLWEHAYYLKYKQDRRAYIDAWWQVVNWDFVEKAHQIVSRHA